jgi:hypothetical protein
MNPERYVTNRREYHGRDMQDASDIGATQLRVTQTRGRERQNYR